MKRKYKEICYFCGEKSCCDEHAPPKQMFKGFSCDSITVPSCTAHNTSKSGNDQAIVSAFLIPLYNGRDRFNLKDDVLIASQNNKSSFERTKYKAVESPLLKDPPEKYKNLPDLAYLVPSVNISSWVRQLTAALVWDGIRSFDPRIKWSNVSIWSPDWVVTDGPDSLEVEQAFEIMKELKDMQAHVDALPWNNGWSAYPNPYPNSIYYFQIKLRDEFEIVFKHEFYKRYSWYVWFQVSPDTYDGIRQKIGA